MSQTKAQLVDGFNINTSVPADSFVIDSSGKVGIGTTAPSTLLHLKANSPYVTFEDDNDNQDWEIRGTSRFALYDVTNSSERLAVDSSGRLLVGTSTSNSAFTSAVEIAGTSADATQLISRYVSGVNGPFLYLSKSRSGTIGTNTIVQSGDQLGTVDFRGANGSGYDSAARIRAYVDGTPGASGDMPGRLVFSTTNDGASSPTPRFRIDSSGRIDHFASADAGHEIHTSSTGASDEVYRVKNGATDLDDGTVVMKILADGDLENTNNSYGAISDIKLKENVVDATSQWGDLKSLQVRKYNFKEETGYGTHTQIGLIAQEVELVSPGLVSESPDRDEDGNDLGTVTKSVNYSVLYMKAVKALQEAMERIEQLETEMAEVKTQLQAS